MNSMRLHLHDLGVAAMILAAIGAVLMPGWVFVEALTGMELSFQTSTVRWVMAGVACGVLIAYAGLRAYARHAEQESLYGERD